MASTEGAVLAVESVPPPHMPVAGRIHAIRWVSPGIRAFELGALGGADLPLPEPGAHIDLHLPGGVVRQYSLLPSARADRYLVAVRREDGGRGGSLFLHRDAQPGMEIGLGAMRNHFAIDETAGASVLLAGGIGMTPMLSMLARLRALGRPVELHLWCRDEDARAFLDLLPDAAPGGAVDVLIHRAGDPGRRSVEAVIAGAGAQAHLYCCGPERMIAAFEAACADRPAGHVHLERFQAAPASAETGSDEGFEVALARSGTSVRVRPDQTMLEALVEAGVDILYSCEQGICGACETRVIAGDPDHRDTIRSAQAHARFGTVMPCCSRSRSPVLVLDL